MPLNHSLRKCNGEFKLDKLQEKINYLMNINDTQLFAKHEKKKKKTRNPDTGSEDIQWHYMKGIWHRKMGPANYEK